MNIINLIISLLSGVAGGNIAGASVKDDKNLGGLGNTITGILGGGLGGIILQLLGVGDQAGSAGLDISSILASIGSGGVGGAILQLIVGYIKKAMQK